MELDRLVVGFFVDEVVGGFFISVPPGHVACVYDRGRGVLPRVWGPGLHLKVPFWQIAKLFNAQIIEYTLNEGFNISNKEALGDVPIRVTTKDGHYIQVEGSILFRINKHKAPQIWENVGDNFVSKFIRPFSRSRLANVFSTLTYDQIQANRSQIEGVLKDALNQEFNDEGLVCEGVLMSEVKEIRVSAPAKIEAWFFPLDNKILPP